MGRPAEGGGRRGALPRDRLPEAGRRDTDLDIRSSARLPFCDGDGNDRYFNSSIFLTSLKIPAVILYVYIPLGRLPASKVTA